MTSRALFVSYASADRAFAYSLVEALELQGCTCWIAPRDVGIGSDYGSSIVSAIRASGIFVLLFSQASNASTHVLREVDRAITAGKPVVPINLDGTEPSEGMEYRLCTLQRLDASVLKNIDGIVEQVVTLVEHERPVEVVGRGPTPDADEAASGSPKVSAKPPTVGLGPRTLSSDRRLDERLRSVLIQIAADHLPFARAVERGRHLGASRDDLTKMAQSLAEAQLLSFTLPLTDDSELSLT